MFLSLLPFIGARSAAADVRIDVLENAWSAGERPVVVRTMVRTWIQGSKRRLENRLEGQVSDSLRRATSFVQIDRVDRDSSYFVRPAENAYLAVPYGPSRDQNGRRGEAMRRARLDGTAPRDTLGPVRVVELGRTRKVAGIACRGVLLELTFAYRDSVMEPGTELTGILADTVWLAPLDSPAGELGRFEREHAATTGSDSLLAAGNAVQVAGQKGLGLVALLARERRKLTGTVLSSHYTNRLRGLPRGMAGVEREPDGTAVLQRTVREAVAVVTDPIPAELFEPPSEARRIERRP